MWCQQKVKDKIISYSIWAKEKHRSFHFNMFSTMFELLENHRHVLHKISLLFMSVISYRHFRSNLCYFLSLSFLSDISNKIFSWCIFSWNVKEIWVREEKKKWICGILFVKHAVALLFLGCDCWGVFNPHLRDPGLLIELSSLGPEGPI